MSGYTKNIAVIKQLKEGFSADSSPLSGLVKCERYGGQIKIEVSKINFAPLSEGRYVCGVSDGRRVVTFEGDLFEGVSDLDTGAGFAALICFVNGTVSPVASAVCGGFASAAFLIKEELERGETLQKKRGESAYEDEAIAEENYYEYAEVNEGGKPVCKIEKEQKDGQKSCENAQNLRIDEKTLADGGGIFYERMKSEIDLLFKNYPREKGLENTVENSKWVKISYGEGAFYVFGVIFGEDRPQYICYGVPAKSKLYPPESMKNLASFIPSEDGAGFWVMYQDASNGASVKIDVE